MLDLSGHSSYSMFTLLLDGLKSDKFEQGGN